MAAPPHCLSWAAAGYPPSCTFEIEASTNGFNIEQRPHGTSDHCCSHLTSVPDVSCCLQIAVGGTGSCLVVKVLAEVEFSCLSLHRSALASEGPGTTWFINILLL